MKSVFRSLIVMLSLMLIGMVMSCDGNSKEKEEEKIIEVDTDPALNGKWVGGIQYDTREPRTYIYTFKNGNYECLRYRDAIDYENWKEEYNNLFTPDVKGTFTTEDNMIYVTRTHVYQDNKWSTKVWEDIDAHSIYEPHPYIIENDKLIVSKNTGALGIIPTTYIKME